MLHAVIEPVLWHPRFFQAPDSYHYSQKSPAI
jgi:hypothetical protein